MSYTVPTYVDTKEQAILALASAVKGEQVAGGDGSVNRALDILADVLAGEDVEVPQTDAGAILALAKLYAAPVLIEKTITANDTYVASDDDADGYSSVTVNVSGGVSLGGPVEVSIAGGGYWYSEFRLGDEIIIVTATGVPDEGGFLVAGGLDMVVNFDDTPAGTPTGTLGGEPFTDFAYDDGVLTVHVPDGGEDEPSLSIVFS